MLGTVLAAQVSTPCWGQGRAPREMLSGKDSSVSAGLGKARGAQGLQIRGFIVLVLALKYF